MISLILWFKLVDGHDYAIVDIQHTNWWSDKTANSTNITGTKTEDGLFLVAKKCWRQRVLMYGFIRQNIDGGIGGPALSQDLIKILSKIEVVTNVPFRHESIRQYRDSDPDLKVWEEDTPEGNIKLCMNIPDQSKLDKCLRRFTALASVFLETAAMYHYAEQALALLDKGDVGSLAGVRKKLESICKVARIEYGNEEME